MGLLGEVLTVNSATSITLAANWHGTTRAGAPFHLKGMEWGDVTRLAVEISALMAGQTEVLSGTGVPSDSISTDRWKRLFGRTRRNTGQGGGRLGRCNEPYRPGRDRRGWAKRVRLAPLVRVCLSAQLRPARRVRRRLLRSQAPRRLRLLISPIPRGATGATGGTGSTGSTGNRACRSVVRCDVHDIEQHRHGFENFHDASGSRLRPRCIPRTRLR